jgi:hypothetical protein
MPGNALYAGGAYHRWRRGAQWQLSFRSQLHPMQVTAHALSGMSEFAVEMRIHY